MEKRKLKYVIILAALMWILTHHFESAMKPALLSQAATVRSEVARFIISVE